MKNLFYVVFIESTGIYQLREKEYHSVLSTARSIEKLEQNITKIVKKYRTPKNLLNKVFQTEGVIPNRKLSKIREEEYKERTEIYDTMIEKAVEEGEKYLEENNPISMLKKRKRKKLSLNVLENREEPETKEEIKEEPTKRRRKLLI